MMLDGYGKGWSEPLAIGRWNRFKQKMREPATKDDYAMGCAVITVVIVGVMDVFAWLL